MITKQKTLFYFVGDQPFKSLEEAQKCDLAKLVPDSLRSGDEKTFSDSVADWMLKNASQIIDTLSTTPTSRLKARKSHGATRKPRKKKVGEVPPVALS